MDYIIVAFLAYLAGSLSIIFYFEYLQLLEDRHDYPVSLPSLSSLLFHSVPLSYLIGEHT